MATSATVKLKGIEVWEKVSEDTKGRPFSVNTYRLEANLYIVVRKHPLLTPVGTWTDSFTTREKALEWANGCFDRILKWT